MRDANTGESSIEPTFGNETPSSVDASGMELNELQILQWQTSSGDHGVTIARAGVCTRATEVSASIASSSQDSLVSTETVEGTVLHIQGDDANALSALHDEVEGEVFDEEVCVVLE